MSSVATSTRAPSTSSTGTFDLLEVYNSDYATELSAPQINDDAWDSPQDALDEWVNRVGFTLEDLRVEHLGKPVGDAAGGEPQPDTLESQPSGRRQNSSKAPR